VSAELDLRRLRELHRHLGTDVSEIVQTLDDELRRALADIEAALVAGDLPAAARAAHAARNSALMIGAAPLLAQLDELESSARAGDLTAARRAQNRVQEHWPALRSELARAAAGTP
jgi:HPt (histidine-containing phosphotransfer) domain-containing protein